MSPDFENVIVVKSPKSSLTPWCRGVREGECVSHTPEESETFPVRE